MTFETDRLIRQKILALIGGNVYEQGKGTGQLFRETRE